MVIVALVEEDRFLMMYVMYRMEDVVDMLDEVTIQIIEEDTMAVEAEEEQAEVPMDHKKEDTANPMVQKPTQKEIPMVAVSAMPKEEHMVIMTEEIKTKEETFPEMQIQQTRQTMAR